MAARIVNLARVPRRPAPAPVALGLAQDLPARLHFWRGASGRRYGHTVYSLIECPPLPQATYLLVHRDHAGHREVLCIASSESNAPTLNLAHLRQRGATLGANEVHVYFQGESAKQRRLVVCDLRAAQFGALTVESGSCRERVASHARLET